jgi:hypothetical protein
MQSSISYGGCDYTKQSLWQEAPLKAFISISAVDIPRLLKMIDGYSHYRYLETRQAFLPQNYLSLTT